MNDEQTPDFGNEESCSTYLVSKFDDLLQGINNLYGRELMEELLKRLEKTIAQFHEDVKFLIDELKKEPEEREVAIQAETPATPPEQPAEKSAKTGSPANDT